jgi:zinc protease
MGLLHTRASGALAVASVLLLSPLSAQSPAPATPAAQLPQTFNLQDNVPINPVVRHGRLPNGLRYLIRQNGQPARRVSLRLGVKAGSLYEADDQQGLAHFLEHMAFNGSANFKPGEVFGYFESVGAQLGPHVNASTGFDQTIYQLDLPTEKPEVINRGLLALSDFAGGLTLDPGQIEKERGIVIEEWRRGLGAGSRIRDNQLPALFYQSRYADRLPIGRPDIIRTAAAARIRAFYDAWYRPDRMVVIAIGDVNPAQLEATIQKTFGPLKPRGPALPEPDMRVPGHKETLINVTTDPEVTATSVQLTMKRPSEGDQRVVDYRRMILEQLFSGILNDRFAVLTRRPDAKFLAANVAGGPLNRETRTFTFAARARDAEMIPDALAALAIEARRAREHGFTEGELDRGKREILAQFERAYNERDKSDSGSYAAEYLRHFFTEEVIPGIEYEYALVRWALPTITLADMAERARVLLSEENRVVLVVTPERPNMRRPAEATVRAALTSADKVAVTPWLDTTTNRALLEKIPEPAAVASRREIPEMGVTIVRFGNGLEAWLKPTDFKNDEILFTMYSPGGASVAPPADFVNASFSTRYVALSGFGGLKALDLDKLLTGKRISSTPFISLSTHGISGSSAPADLETALQLLYQEFTSPGSDPEAFALMKRQLEASVANRGQDPNQVFGERAELLNNCNHYTSQPVTPEVVKTVDAAKMIGYYRERFSNAADFTFFMVGSFDRDAAIAHLARYLGSLPSTGKKTASFRDLKMCFPAKSEVVRVEKGREPRSQTVMSFFADVPPDPMEQEQVTTATFVLDTVLRDVLREDLGQTYTVSVGLAQSLPQRGDGNVQIHFEAAPENIQGMIDRVLQEIKTLQEKGPSADLVARAKESGKRNYEQAMRENGYWMRRLQSIHTLGGNPTDLITRAQRIDAVTPASVAETLRKYLPLNRHTIITLVPERPAAASGAR